MKRTNKYVTVRTDLEFEVLCGWSGARGPGVFKQRPITSSVLELVNTVPFDFAFRNGPGKNLDYHFLNAIFHINSDEQC